MKVGDRIRTIGFNKGLEGIEGETMKKILVNDGLREFLDPKDCFVKQVFPKLEFEEK